MRRAALTAIAVGVVVEFAGNMLDFPLALAGGALLVIGGVTAWLFAEEREQESLGPAFKLTTTKQPRHKP